MAARMIHPIRSLSTPSDRYGFTIVELLIVIVVIGILAAITIVGYNGVARSAEEAGLKSDVSNGVKALQVSHATNDQYPTSCADASVKVSVGNQLACTTSTSDFCISVSRGDRSYFATRANSSPQAGACSGLAGVPSGAPTYASQQVVKLLASDGAANDGLGISAAIDGDTAVVGASFDDTRGSAYVYVRSGGTWTQQAKLVASDRANYDAFGQSVSISGNTIVVGAPMSSNYRGSAYVFTRSGTTWTQQTKLTASDGVDNDAFGQDVGVSGDSIAVGASSHAARGATYVYARSGSTWSQQAKLFPTTTSYAGFGGAVALEGSTVAIGASNDSGQGSVHVFTRSGTTWSQQAKLVPTGADPQAFFGVSVALAGETLVAGAMGDVGGGYGATYVFTRSGTAWSQQARLVLSIPGSTSYYFGTAVAAEGDVVYASTPYDETNRGSFYAFTRSTANWTFRQKLTASDTGSIELGHSIAVDQGRVVIGAPKDATRGNSAGAVYIFE